MISSLDTYTISIALLALSLLAVILLIFTYWRPIKRVTAHTRRRTREPELTVTPEGCTPVSVIVYATENHSNLENLIESILGQTYAAPFEIIIVNDGATDETSAMIDRYRVRHSNIYQTFTPDSARNVSRKKLSLMLGLKAARYPVVLLTTGNCLITSDLWLARMMHPFASDPSTDIVIGHAYTDPDADSTVGSGGRAFGETADAVAWLTAALAGKPYRGTENNIAYRRDTFFDNRGFSRSLNLVNGDDDIFISEIARPDNTTVVLHPEAHIVRLTNNPRLTRRETKTRYAYTGRYIPKHTRRQLAFGSWMLWLQFITAVTALVLVANNLITGVQAKIAGEANASLPTLAIIIASTAIVLTLTTIVVTMIIWRQAVKELGHRTPGLSVLPYALARPFGNISSEIAASRHSERFHTWTR